MDSFRETAFYLTVWHAFLATLGAILLIVINDFEPTTALLIAANLALVFSLVLIARVGRLTEYRIKRGQIWNWLPPKERPAGEAGLRMARQVLEVTWLRFAKGAAVVAIVMTGLAYASHDVSFAAWGPSVTSTPAPGSTLVSTYRNGRLLPIY
jgi:hypothetical protein